MMTNKEQMELAERVNGMTDQERLTAAVKLMELATFMIAGVAMESRALNGAHGHVSMAMDFANDALMCC